MHPRCYDLIFFRLYKIILVFFGFIITGCNANESFITSQKPQFDNITFDVVQKQLVIDTNMPDYVLSLVSQWFDQKVKINGFDGDMKFTVTQYDQEITSISDGKRVDISLQFRVLLNKPSLSQTKFIEGGVSSYGTLSGNFSLSEFDQVIQNTQIDLISRLSQDLQSKI